MDFGPPTIVPNVNLLRTKVTSDPLGSARLSDWQRGERPEKSPFDNILAGKVQSERLIP